MTPGRAAGAFYFTASHARNNPSGFISSQYEIGRLETWRQCRRNRRSSSRLVNHFSHSGVFSRPVGGRRSSFGFR